MIGTYQNEGILVLDQKETMSMPGEEANRQNPIEFMPSGINEDFNQLRARIMDQIELFRQTTGVNEVSDGTSRNADMLQSVMTGLSDATNSALGPYMQMYTESNKYIFAHIAYKYQTMVLSGTIDVGHLIFGSFVKKVILDNRLTKHQFIIGVLIQTKESKQLLKEYLLARQDTLPPDAFFVIQMAIDSNDLKKAQFLLSKYIQASLAQAHQRQVEVAKATAQGNAEAGVAVEQERAKSTAEVSKVKIQEINVEYDRKTELEKLLSDLRMKENNDEHKRKMEREIAAIEANNRNRLNQ